MADNKYIVILKPMTEKLKLTGNNLLVFALIHGFSQDGESEFHGSLNYICNWFGITKNSAISILKKLCEMNYISKNEVYKNGVKFCFYKSKYSDAIKNFDSGAKITPPVKKVKHGGAKIVVQGGVKIAPNNTININTNKENIDIRENNATEVASHSQSNSEIEFVEYEEIQYVETTSVEIFEKPEKVARAKFVKPTVEEIRSYSFDIDSRVDPEYFFDYYESNGWMVGKNKMKDWKSAFRNWSKKEQNKNNNGFKTKRQQHEEELQQLAEKCARDSYNAQFITRAEELKRLEDIPF